MENSALEEVKKLYKQMDDELPHSWYKMNLISRMDEAIFWATNAYANLPNASAVNDEGEQDA